MEFVVPNPSSWAIPPSELILGENEIHVWHAALQKGQLDMEDLRRALSPDEVERSSKYLFGKDSGQFIKVRGLLRYILARYIEAEPSDIRFSYTRYGKPEIVEAQNPHHVKFNVSHAGERALIAVTRRREVGVDIEQWKGDIIGEEIAERFFSQQEVAALRKLPEEKQLEGFFNCWSRKEAYIKARGEGLLIRLSDFSVTLAPDQPAALVHTNGDLRDASAWSLTNLPVGQGYSAAVAVKGASPLLRLWQWAR